MEHQIWHSIKTFMFWGYHNYAQCVRSVLWSQAYSKATDPKTVHSQWCDVAFKPHCTQSIL